MRVINYFKIKRKMEIINSVFYGDKFYVSKGFLYPLLQKKFLNI